jgi:preprotein translocase subunit SecF
MKSTFGNITFFPRTLRIDFMKGRKLTITLSLLLTIASIAVIAIKGLNYSIDFLGGSEINFSSTDLSLDQEKVKELVAATGASSFEVNEFQDEGSNRNAFVVRLQRERGQAEQAVSDAANKLVNELRAAIGDEKFTLDSVTNVSGKVGKEEENRGYLALLLSFLGILAYVWYRFDLRFAPGAVLCLVHDVVIALGLMTVMDRPFTVASVAAFLTIVGYSINDTVIVYDRIRETVQNNPRLPIEEAVNTSISQTLNRTVLTSFTSLFALTVLTIWGGGSIEDFALTMLIGIVIGTYSSIYVAAPAALLMDEWLRKRGIVLHDPSRKKVAQEVDYCPPVVLKRRPGKS